MRICSYIRRTILPALLLLLLTTVPVQCGAENGNLLKNGSFEILGKDGLPESWFTDAYRMEPGYSLYSITTGMEDGSSAAEIRNTTKNDSRFAQEVEVEPDSLYCLSGYLRAENIEEGHGANLSIEGVYAFSESVFNTQGEWRYIEYYGETGPDQQTVTVFARVGGYSGESRGTAAFDDLKLEKIETLPEGVFPDLWYTEKDIIYSEDGDEDTQTDLTSAGVPGPAWPMLLAVGLIYCIAVAALVYNLRDGENSPPRGNAGTARLQWAPLLTLAFIVRLVFSYMIKGYDVDVNCFVSWGYTMAHAGPTGFYLQTSFCDYPPLYTYILGLNSWLCGILHADDGWTRVIFRLIPSLCDITACWILLHFPKNTFTQSRFYRTIILLMAFNPATIVNSAAWGQMDSVLCLILLCVALCALEGRWTAAVILYAAAVLVKPQALMLGILGAVIMATAALRDREARRKILTGIAAGTALIAAAVIPFSLNQKPGWLISLYSNTLSSYPYATVNTANLYYILGGNWSKIETAANTAAPAILACACALHGFLWYRYNQTEKFSFAEVTASAAFTVWFIVCAAFRFSWMMTGIGAMAYAFLIVISIAVRKREIRLLPYLGALLFILLYVFGIKMHERYLFPALLLLAAAWAVLRDRRILYLLAVFSLTCFVNEGIVLDNSIRLGAEMGHLNADTTWLADILSVLNTAGAFYAVYLGYDLAQNHHPGPVRNLPRVFPLKNKVTERNASDYHPCRKLQWTIRDTVVLCGITLVYAFVSLSTLGSTKAPQTAWKSSDEHEQIVFDLGEIRDDIRILYFGQVSREDFSWATSRDGEHWSGETWAQMDQGQCWKWKYVTQSFEAGDRKRSYYNDTAYVAHFSGRYVRLTAHQVGLTLNEVIFRDEEGSPIPAAVYSRAGGTSESVLWSEAENLLDEQDTMEKLPGFFGLQQEGEAQPSWWNSTYFDEIYHARTGFEFMNGTVPYETSHPPLGKVLISWCIMAFGMTPFGWRLAGALAGIAMLPGIYLLAKQLTKKTYAAVFACSLMALDCMHLTQTQIATIDSFPVLFIIFAFFFMLRFMQTDLGRCSMREALIPLALSGLNMGFAIASKWIGIYAGIGLAALYFWHCCRSIRIADKAELQEKSEQPETGYNAENTEKPENSQANEIKEKTKCPDVFRRVIFLCAWCILFFIVIPASIYLVSYIPYLAYSTRIHSLSDYLAAVWRCQESMLSYHSTPGLGMDHPFYSPWWEWPVIGKPMFYATEQYIDSDAALHHSIFCFGNPAVWWGALAALVICMIRWAAGKRYITEENGRCWHLKNRNYDIRYEFVFIGLLAQYLPWVLVPRGTYIYHYFASVPFLILAMSLCLTETDEKKLRRTRMIIGSTVLAAAAILFILLLPYVTGMAVPAGWLEIGKHILRIWY